jgi:uncharacterized protein (UPF0276 family)
VRELKAADRVGIGWRRELAAGILTNLERIDLVEVIADDLFRAPARELRAMKTLAAQVPVVLHGVSLGLASSLKVDTSRLEALARVVHAIEPEFWSEHLAFVRGDGLEIGHLAAPPRTLATVHGAAENVARARRIVGAAPLLENVATLIEPPGSELSEVDWIARVLVQSDAPLLLDLNNLYSNAVNFGSDPLQLLCALPLDRVRAVHLAGGKWIGPAGRERLLDDHLHAVPEPVYGLLTELAARAPQPLSVVLERDGAYPAFGELLAELERARQALLEGRGRAVVRVPAAAARSEPPRRSDEAQALERFLVRLYTDEPTRRGFLRSPELFAARAGLESDVSKALVGLDRVGLELAAQSFAHKRERKRP